MLTFGGSTSGSLGAICDWLSMQSEISGPALRLRRADSALGSTEEGSQMRRSPVTRAEEYIFKAAELSALAEDEVNPTLSSGFRQLAEGCLRVAEQLDRDSETDVVNDVLLPDVYPNFQVYPHSQRGEKY
jgi:hypothetical protein